ncbi:MAG TPA: methionyl-tRNA formyltransferase [Pseudomonas oleovorans]|nr:methionyl-tRNA formyltransferase [Pseudomonas oleovorans]
MRVVLVGQKWLAVQLLERCLALGIEVVQVIAPEPQHGAEPDSLERAASARGIAVCRAGRRVRAEQIPPCDVLLAAHAHSFIGAAARSKARLGALGYHPSLLPRHRGRDAIHWAVHMREPVTGGSLYWMNDGADTGPVVAQAWCHIRPGDTATTLWRRDLAPIGLTLFDQVLVRLKAGDLCEGLEQDPALATWEPAWRVGSLAP